MTPEFKAKVRAASLITLYHLVQIRAAWRECLTLLSPPRVDRTPAIGPDQDR